MTGQFNRPVEPAQPGIIPLRPLNLGDVYGGAIAAVRANPRATFGIASVVAALMALIGMALGAYVTEELPPLDGRRIEEYNIGDIAGVLPAVLLYFLGWTALVLVVSATVNIVVLRGVFGLRTSERKALALGGPMVLRMFGLSVLLAFVFALCVGVAALLAMVSVPVSASVGVATVVAAIYLMTVFTFTSSVIVIERVGMWKSLSRSAQLVRGVGWWRVFGIVLLANVIALLFGAVVEAVFNGVFGVDLMSVALNTLVVETVTMPLLAAVSAVLYVDHRCRLEGVEGLWRDAGLAGTGESS